MQTKKYFLTNPFNLLMVGLLSIVFVSCGTSRYAAEDGIYGASDSDTQEVATEDNSSYYKQYFKTKNAEYESLPEEDLIFTDIDAYVSDETIDEEGYIVPNRSGGYEDGYGAWGSNSDNITVNIYETGFNNWGWGGGYWGWNNPWGWNSWGWGGYWGWNAGFGWGWGGYYGYGGYWGWNNPWIYNGWGGYYGHPYYYNGYYNGGYGTQVAYNRGRRNGDYGRTATRSNNRSYSRGENSRRAYRSDARSSVGRYYSRNNNSARTNRSSRYNQNRQTNRHLDFQDLLLALDHQVRCEVLAGHDRQDHEAEVALEEVADADKFQTISY